MKTIKINLYEFEELPEDIQKKVLDNNRDINVRSDWWEQIYEDAQNIGCKITGFDTDRGNHCDLEFQDHSLNVADKIILNHGEQCDTYKLAAQFLLDYDRIPDDQNRDDAISELESEFEKGLGEEYLKMLREELEYLYSDEGVKDTILSNEYTFEITGKMNNT